MRNLLLVGIATAALCAGATAALAEPIMIGDDEGYSRLQRWESHLDDRISQAVRGRALSPYRAWTIQKELDSVEIHLLQSYYDANNGIDPATYRRYADRLRQIGSEIGDTGWREESFNDSDYGPSGYDQGPPPPNYYQAGRYESDCHRGNVAAGTIFGALAGGLIGSAASHGNGGAVAGGVIAGGLLGNALSRDIDCDDQRYAYSSYNDGLNGDLDREYRWNHDDRYGTFVATREYYNNGYVCRDFHTVNYRNGQRYERDGTACREADGYWHFQ